MYPIKSCGGVAVEEWGLDEPALRHDCRIMLVDETGRFMSQRQLPCMALIKVRIERRRPRRERTKHVIFCCAASPRVQPASPRSGLGRSRGDRDGG